MHKKIKKKIQKQNDNQNSAQLIRTKMSQKQYDKMNTRQLDQLRQCCQNVKIENYKLNEMIRHENKITSMLAKIIKNQSIEELKFHQLLEIEFICHIEQLQSSFKNKQQELSEISQFIKYNNNSNLSGQIIKCQIDLYTYLIGDNEAEKRKKQKQKSLKQINHQLLREKQKYIQSKQNKSCVKKAISQITKVIAKEKQMIEDRTHLNMQCNQPNIILKDYEIEKLQKELAKNEEKEKDLENRIQLFMDQQIQQKLEIHKSIRYFSHQMSLLRNI